MHTITFNQKSATGYVRFSNEDSHAVIHATRQSGALATVIVGAFDDAAVANILSLPSGETPVALMPVGWPDTVAVSAG